MTRSFGRSLEEFGVDYLVISGQATVLYEAADFSEDLDVGVEPSEANIGRLVTALRREGGRFYKLTPPLNESNMRRGHGFHFVVGEKDPFYLDVMGQPPRVGAFGEAFGRRQVFETNWGAAPVVGLKDLAEIKKTQRLRDYSIIGLLALRWMERPEFSASKAEANWVMENLFSVADLEEVAEKHAEIAGFWPDGKLKEFVQGLVADGSVAAELEEEIEATMHLKIAALQRADRNYWKGIIAELRTMRAEGTLVEEGSAVQRRDHG